MSLQTSEAVDAEKQSYVSSILETCTNFSAEIQEELAKALKAIQAKEYPDKYEENRVRETMAYNSTAIHHNTDTLTAYLNKLDTEALEKVLTGIRQLQKTLKGSDFSNLESGMSQGAREFCAYFMTFTLKLRDAQHRSYNALTLLLASGKSDEAIKVKARGQADIARDKYEVLPSTVTTDASFGTERTRLIENYPAHVDEINNMFAAILSSGNNDEIKSAQSNLNRVLVKEKNWTNASSPHNEDHMAFVPPEGDARACVKALEKAIHMYSQPAEAAGEGPLHTHTQALKRVQELQAQKARVEAELRNAQEALEAARGEVGQAREGARSRVEDITREKTGLQERVRGLEEELRTTRESLQLAEQRARRAESSKVTALDERGRAEKASRDALAGELAALISKSFMGEKVDTAGLKAIIDRLRS